MSWGVIHKDFEEPIRKTVKGKVVLDIGAGDLDLASQLLKLGAKRIVAVDKEIGKTRSKRIVRYGEYLDNFLKRVYGEEGLRWDVAFLSWPSNWHMPGLRELLFFSKKIVVLSKNSDATACGTSGLWRYLQTRELEWAIPNVRNWLHIYSHDEDLGRAPTGEERAGILLDVDRSFSYEEIYHDPIRQNERP